MSPASNRILWANWSRYKIALLLVATLAFFATMLELSSIKPLWYDEIFTYRIATLPSINDILTQMRQAGGDTTPPLLMVMSHVLLQYPLSPELGVRLFSMMGYWLMVVCVCFFTLRHVSWPLACVAAILALNQFYYAVEGRPYGVLLGGTGLGMVLWRKAVENPARRLYPVLFGICCLVVSCVHFYGALVLLPFFLAEAARYRIQGIIHWPVLGALVAGALGTFTIIPYACYAYKFSHNFWAPPTRWSSIDACFFLYGSTVFYLMGLLVIIHILLHFFVYRRPWNNPPSPEIVFLIALGLMPLWVHVISCFTNAYTARYALAGIPGGAVLTAYLLGTLPYRKLSTMLALAITIGVLSQMNATRQQMIEDGSDFRKKVAILEGFADTHPDAIYVTPDNHLYLRLAHYARSGITLFYEGDRVLTSAVLSDLNKISSVNILSSSAFKAMGNFTPVPGAEDILVRTSPSLH